MKRACNPPAGGTPERMIKMSEIHTIPLKTNNFNRKKPFFFRMSLLTGILLLVSSISIAAQNVLSPEMLLGLKGCGISQLSPDGGTVLYSVTTPRNANEEPGAAHVEYFKLQLSDNSSSPLFSEDMKGSSPVYSPDGSWIAFLYQKDKGKKQVWVMPANGGGTPKQVTASDSDVSFFRWHPDGKGMAYISADPLTKREEELKERGYDFIFFEENLKESHIYLIRFDEAFNSFAKKQLTDQIHVWDFIFNESGTMLAFSGSAKNLIDYRYMFRTIYVLDVQSAKVINDVGNKGKPGNYAFSPNGEKLVYTSALNMNDHAVSQVFTYDLNNGERTNHTPAGFKGHYSWAEWKNNDELLCLSGEGVYPKLSLVNVKSSERSVVLDARENGIIFGIPHFTKDMKQIVFTGNTPVDPANIYAWNGADQPGRITDLNPQLSEVAFGEQEVIRYKARDGMEIEGLLIYPEGYSSGDKYPLLLYVHGGPESHHSNGWLSRYATPGQVMAGKGYLVAYLNYRASTGYGVDFAMEGFMDPAGKEFDDLADGIEYLITEKGADRDRVGMAGGSYGGYASAWFATYYTKYVKAVCMFVGISDLISKRGTTDIPYEELYVHSGKPLEEQWQMNLERSPIYYAHQSKTATLIYGGASDTRVHPSQSKELYRRMKMNNHPAVRLVQYPGEGHGNRKQVGQIDVLLRQIDWLDWYVKHKKPLDGPMPPLDISGKYGLDWDMAK